MDGPHPSDKDNPHQPKGPKPGEVFGADGRQIADPESTCNPADKTGSKKGEKFVPNDIDSHHFRRNIVVPDGNPCSSDPRPKQIDHTGGTNDHQNEHHKIDLGIVVNHPGADFDGSGWKRKGLPSTADLADILRDDEIDGDELSGHGR